MKKEYFNQEAYNYIASQINKTKINSVFKPIVIDIILRRRHEYQLDDKYFHRDVESFINNVKDIYCENLPNNVGARFYSQKKCISINQNVFTENMNDEQGMGFLLEKICHECVHAMNSDGTGLDRTFKEVDTADKALGMNGVFEIFTEKEADRISCNRNLEDAFKYYNETTAYSTTTPFVNAIAVAFGIKEKELLSAAIKGEQELYEALNANIKDENFSEDKFKKISLNIRNAYRELYRNKDDKFNSENLAGAFKTIYETSEQILAYRINNLEWDDLEELQEKLEDIKLSQNAISNIMPEADKKWAMSEKSGKRMVYAKVMCMEKIIKSQDENSRELISFVQNSENVDEILEFMKQNGIEINSKNLALMPEFELSQQKKDEWVKEFCLDGEEWDNTEIINYMIANKEEIMNAKEKVSNKIKRGIGRIIKPYKDLWKASKTLWRKAFPNKNSNEEPLLLDERETRKNRRQEIMGFI